MEDNKQAERRKGGLLHTTKAIGWAFFGVRGGRAHDLDRAHLNPAHVIIVGLLLAAVFVVVLVLLAKWAVG
ncbi:MAG: DUF2970 domain-containing protein [Gammaproteobacteria bacterium]